MEFIRVDAQSPDSQALLRAAQVLQRGGLVAFPTETVYGLGANAESDAAVARVFAAKGRPAANPLIVHIPSLDWLDRVAREVPAAAMQLAAAFWPGPLTLVLPKRDSTSSLATAGGATVAVRMPNHAVALGLLRACRLPVAAPSANRSQFVSATTAQHVLDDLGDRVDVILDAGPATGGIESTVLDLTVQPARILRPGLITAAQIAAHVELHAETTEPTEATRYVDFDESVARSPGAMPLHYSPNAKVILASGTGMAEVAEIIALGRPVAWLQLGGGLTLPGVTTRALPADAGLYGAGLYACLRELDAQRPSYLVVAMPPEGGAWDAIRDRLKRAAGPKE